jgi:hypothetical protein
MVSKLMDTELLRCVWDDRMSGRSVETRLVRDEYFAGDPRASVAALPQLPLVSRRLS